MRQQLMALSCAALLTSCTGISLLRTINKTDDALSPEQIEAYSKVGHKVYGCFYLAGPAVNGSTTWLVVPSDAPAPDVKFGPTCTLMVPNR